MKSRLVFKIILCIALCLGLGIASGFVAGSASTGWYQNLNKPFFQPPPWIFGPAWTLLYTLMGVAVAKVWHIGGEGQKKALGLFVFQFILNLIWSPVFFKMHQPGFALVIILILLVMVFLTIRKFSKMSQQSAYLLYPYFLWLCFATVLNASIVYLN